MLLRPLLASALLSLPLAAIAESPNIEPGQWRFTSTTSVEGDMPIPDQTETYQECIAQSDLDDGSFDFIEEEEGCELLEHNVSADGIDYQMICREEGGEATIDGNMAFLGERTEGNVDILVDSQQMGQMQMQTVIEGERTGDC
jgi:hypothetical protein